MPIISFNISFKLGQWWWRSIDLRACLIHQRSKFESRRSVGTVFSANCLKILTINEKEALNGIVSKIAEAWNG